jgi:hypothetical protein
MSFKRERYKAAKLESNKTANKEFDIFKMNKLERGDYHTIDMGINVFRILPPHNEDEPSFQPKAVYWLDTWNEKRDEHGKGLGKWERSRRPIFDSRIHGGTEKDIVDEFIKFARKYAWDNYQDKEGRAKVLTPITGWRGKDGKWNTGILCSQSFVCYATKDEIVPKNIGRLEIFKQDKEKLEELNIAEESDDPITTDIFSDPDDGVQFTIRLYTGDDGKTQRTIAKVKEPSTKGLKGKERDAVLDEFYESQVVPDDVLEHLDKMQPLSEMFKDAYKRSDFERALEALEYLDENKLKFGIFKNDEWLDIVDEIDQYYPEKEDKKNDDDDDADLDDMSKAELREYAKENHPTLRLKQSWSEDQIRDAIKKAEGINDDNGDDDDEPETETPKKPSVKESALDSIRKKKAAKQPIEEDEDEDEAPKTTTRKKKVKVDDRLPF